MDFKKIMNSEEYDFLRTYERLAMDENDEITDNIKRGVLSEDGIYNMLERNKEIMDFMRED